MIVATTCYQTFSHAHDSDLYMASLWCSGQASVIGQLGFLVAKSLIGLMTSGRSKRHCTHSPAQGARTHMRAHTHTHTQLHAQTQATLKNLEGNANLWAPCLKKEGMDNPMQTQRGYLHNNLVARPTKQSTKTQSAHSRSHGQWRCLPPQCGRTGFAYKAAQACASMHIPWLSNQQELGQLAHAHTHIFIKNSLSLSLSLSKCCEDTNWATFRGFNGY